MLSKLLSETARRYPRQAIASGMGVQHVSQWMMQRRLFSEQAVAVHIKETISEGDIAEKARILQAVTSTVEGIPPISAIPQVTPDALNEIYRELDEKQRVLAMEGLVEEVVEYGKKIDGTFFAKQVHAEVKETVSKMDYAPGLGVILVGNRPDSASYVRNKTKGAKECGFHLDDRLLPDSASEEEILRTVDELNSDPKVHGILVQLPLPVHVDAAKVLRRIHFDKDVDGFSAENTGNLALKGGDPLALACTPHGCMELLKRSGVEVGGKNCVVLGRSNIVGTPAALMLMHANATVTICHSRTKDIKKHVSEADIVIAAIGKPGFVRGDWLKPGAVVIDVGINKMDDATRKRGYRLVGDVNFEECSKKASLITPVPGGVGPMTIAMLLQNTLRLAQRVETKME